MVQKRPLGEESYEVSSKQPRQLEPTDEMISVLEFPDKNVTPKSHDLGESVVFPRDYNPEYYERLEGGDVAKLRAFPKKELEASVSVNISNSSWVMSTTREEDIRSEPPFRILLSPDHYNHDLPVRNIIHDGVFYSSLLEYPPRKLVPIGSEFQAEIPEWGVYGNGKTSTCLGDTSEELNLPSESLKSDISGHLDDERLAGTCVIPMPELDMSGNNKDKPGGGRINCCCEDVGSIRCVRQHIKEAREKLRASLGQEIFLELGFYEMGEVVSEKWSEEEEKIFHDVVYTNPASFGKNFWDHLVIEFPSRTKKEIVSYYFNVFMLRKRAEQNRFDPLTIDSDNDEWEGTDDSADEEVEKINDRDDSVVESPGYGDGFDHNETYEDNKYGESKDIAHETLEDDKHENFGGNRIISNVSKSGPGEVLDNCRSVPSSDGVLSNEQGGQEIHGSCILDDTGIAPKFVSSKVNNSKHWTGSPSRLSSSSGHEFLLEPCSSKEWDVGYLTCPKNEDFLPTCSVIEEVFGAGAWNYKTRDG